MQVVEAVVVIGVDAHKKTHTFAAADGVGRELASTTLAATGDGHRAAVAWAAQRPLAAASPTRSTRWPSRGLPGASPTSRSPNSTAPHVKCGCWSITARTWSANEPAC